MPAYDPAPFVLPVPRFPGGTVWAEVTWHPSTGEPHGVLATYATSASGGHIALIPGAVPVIAADLGRPALAGEHTDRIARWVDTQLRVQPWAELRCPAGRAEVVLYPRRSR